MPAIVVKRMSVLTAAVVNLLAGPAATAQCVLCYMSASSTGERGASVLRTGILVLLIPTVVIFGAVFFLVLRRREPAAGKGHSVAASGSDETLLPLAGPENQSPSVL